jgi:hypothetical protein
MGIRGRKPKPTHLHLVEGTLNVTRHAGILDAPETAGHLAKPRYIARDKRASAIWDEIVAGCWWLGEVDGYKLGMWCAMQAEFEKSPKGMIASRIAQLRGLGCELGLDPSSRSRLGAMKGGRGQPQGAVKTKNPFNYFGD